MSDRIHWILDGDGQPMPPRDQPGYYPGFSTLGQRAFWDEATRRTVMKRVEEVPPLRFFAPDEARLLEGVVARVLPQWDRTPARQIPIVPFIDERLHEGRQDGYRYESMPPDGEVHRLGLRAIEAGAQARFGRGFLDLEPAEKDAILRAIHDGKPVAAEEIWSRMNVHRYWLLLMTDVCHVYYAHPWAWDEIGFGGPAYPRGYMRLENGEPEPWEVEERRYEWSAAPSADSSRYELVAGLEEHYGSSQGGTH